MRVTLERTSLHRCLATTTDVYGEESTTNAREHEANALINYASIKEKSGACASLNETTNRQKYAREPRRKILTKKDEEQPGSVATNAS
jgi:hypothetical protein